MSRLVSKWINDEILWKLSKLEKKFLTTKLFLGLLRRASSQKCIFDFTVYQIISIDLWIGSDLILTSEGCSILTIIFVPGESTRQRVSPPTIHWSLDLLVYLGHTIIRAYDGYFDFLHIFQPITYNITLRLTYQICDVIGSKAALIEILWSNLTLEQNSSWIWLSGSTPMLVLSTLSLHSNHAFRY